jgi:hypothetical protein
MTLLCIKIGESFEAIGAFFGPTPDSAWSIKNGAPPLCSSDTPCDGWSEWMDGHVVEAEPSILCGAPSADNARRLKGRVALITRGKCTFLDKVLNAQTAGAVAVIMGNIVDANNMFMMVHIP